MPLHLRIPSPSPSEIVGRVLGLGQGPDVTSMSTRCGRSLTVCSRSDVTGRISSWPSARTPRSWLSKRGQCPPRHICHTK